MTNSYEMDQQRFAELCGVKRNAIMVWTKEGMPGVTKPSRNSVYIDLTLAIPWVKVNKWAIALDDRARKAKAEADMAEMEAMTMAGTLVNAKFAAVTWEEFLARLKSNLRGFPDRIVPRLEEGGTLAEKLAIARREMDSTLRDIVAQESR